MFTFAILASVFSDCCIAQVGSSALGQVVKSIEIISEGGAYPQENTVYIGDSAAIASFLRQSESMQDIMCIASGGAGQIESTIQREDISLLYCSIPVEEISNRAVRFHFQFAKWQDTMYRLCADNKDAAPLLAHAVTIMKAPVFLLNSGYRLIASNVEYAFEHPIVQQLLSFGYLSAENIEQLVNGKLTQEENTHQLETVIDGLHYGILQSIQYRQGIYGRLLVISDTPQRSCALADQTNALCGHLLNHAKIHIQEEMGHNTEFSSLIADIIDKKISGKEELQSRLFRMPAMPKKFYTCIVVTFDGDLQYLPIGLISQTLAEIFRDSHIAVYRGDLIILSYKQTKELVPDYHNRIFEDLLTQYHGYACIGNSSEFMRSVRPIYLQSKSVIALGRALRHNDHRRIFKYNDYIVYHIIDLCAQYGCGFHENNLVYLCTPQYTALKRYDHQKNDNLCDIMKVYIQSNCNTSQTAKELHFHRNTIINKIARIESIVGGSLNDWDLQFKLMLSSMVAEYTEKFRQDDLFQLK